MKQTKKEYKAPTLQKFGDMVKLTLPGGSKNTEGGSGKAHGT